MKTSTSPNGDHIRPAQMDDVPAAVDLFNACARDLIGVADYSVENLAREWRTPGFNLETDTRVIHHRDGRLLGYYELWDSGGTHTTLFTWGRVHPAYQGNGIGARLLSWAEERAHQALTLAPAGARVVLRAFVMTQDEAAIELLQSQGFTLVRHNLRMVTRFDQAPPQPEIPTGLTIRTFQGESDLRPVTQAVHDSFRDHWGYFERPLDDDVARYRQAISEDPHFDPSLWFLAVDEAGQIAGISLCRPFLTEDPEMGWVNTLGVVREYRRRGLGMALLLHSFAELYRRGICKVGLGVDAQSLTGATRLYEKAGMKSDPQRTFATFEKELRPGTDLTTTHID